ncbi:MAG: acetyl-CoA carboxylase biotin carboxyl carrier protein [Puniceicoccales bacterium]|jgi:acetyl-CoA carboxylase biotin carboxyl carrier protein|nr:acetyl-CoA carboxylase biotin carboxyl carrier protein [Puniceicoccales bacterium]
MELEEIERLAEMMGRCGIESLELERGDWRLRLGKSCSGNQPVRSGNENYGEPKQENFVVSSPQKAHDDNSCRIVHSPMIGSFYRAPAPGRPAFVEVGSTVSADSTVCIIEAMKVLNEITADIGGIIVEVLVEDGQAVEFGQPLFRVAVKE